MKLEDLIADEAQLRRDYWAAERAVRKLNRKAATLEQINEIYAIRNAVGAKLTKVRNSIKDLQVKEPRTRLPRSHNPPTTKYRNGLTIGAQGFRRSTVRQNAA